MTTDETPLDIAFSLQRAAKRIRKGSYVNGPTQKGEFNITLVNGQRFTVTVRDSTYEP